MPDDLYKLTPTDPSNVDPNWSKNRQSILDDVLAAPPQSGRRIGRWVAGAAAAALVVVAVGGVVQQLRPEPYATPASPTPTNSTVNGGQLVAARALLLQAGTGMTLCNGYMMESDPPQCSYVMPVTGITWDDVPWAESADGITFAENVIIVGTFDGETFVATQVFRDGDQTAPQPPSRVTDEDLPTLCENPTRGTGPYSVETLITTAEALPGYQALWLSPNQITTNAAFTEDVEGARSALAEVFGGELCVGTVEGPTEQALQDAELALEPLTMDEDSDALIPDSVWSTSSSVSRLGNRLEVIVERNTPELLSEIEAAVGDEVWPHTDVRPFFYPVLNDPSPAPTTAPAPTPSSMPKLEDTFIAEGGMEYRDGQLNLCYSRTYTDFSSCRAAIPLLGLDPKDVDWDRGSAEAGRAFTDAVVVGTVEGNGIRVERVQEDVMEVSGVGYLPTTKDADALRSAAADLVSSYDGDPFAPTTEVDETDPEGARLIVHVLLATDDAMNDVRDRVGEDIWQYTHVRPFIASLGF